MRKAPPTSELPPIKRSLFCKLRIAVSVFIGVLTVAIVVLWVRSAWRADWLWGEIYPSTYWQIGSQHGNVIALHESRPGVLKTYEQNNASPYFWSSVKSRPMDYHMRWSFDWQKGQIAIPHWFIVIIAASLATVPWIKWQRRFSLRTLLIATALLAVVLRLAVWAGR